jgi:flagellar biosynthetic protein FliQ
MPNEFILDIIQETLKTTLILSAPMLIGAVVIGILVSLFQAVTQINEQTLSFIPKILVIVGAIVVFSPWMMDVMTTFTRDIILNIPEWVVNQ